MSKNKAKEESVFSTRSCRGSSPSPLSCPPSPARPRQQLAAIYTRAAASARRLARGGPGSGSGARARTGGCHGHGFHLHAGEREPLPQPLLRRLAAKPDAAEPAAGEGGAAGAQRPPGRLHRAGAGAGDRQVGAAAAAGRAGGGEPPGAGQPAALLRGGAGRRPPGAGQHRHGAGQAAGGAGQYRRGAPAAAQQVGAPALPPRAGLPAGSPPAAASSSGLLQGEGKGLLLAGSCVLGRQCSVLRGGWVTAAVTPQRQGPVGLEGLRLGETLMSVLKMRCRDSAGSASCCSAAGPLQHLPVMGTGLLQNLGCWVASWGQYCENV